MYDNLTPEAREAIAFFQPDVTFYQEKLRAAIQSGQDQVSNLNSEINEKNVKIAELEIQIQRNINASNELGSIVEVHQG